MEMKKKKQYLWYFNPKKLPNELHEKAVFALTHLFFLKKKKDSINWKTFPCS